MYLLNEEKEVEKEQPQGITQEHDRTEPNEEEVREELFKVKRHECMKARDRFFFNQFFPIRHEHLSEQFLEQNVTEEKKQLLLRLSLQRCQLIGIVGRRAFHIFDKTHKTWICSSKKLGYKHLADIRKSDNEEDTNNSGADANEPDNITI